MKLKLVKHLVDRSPVLVFPEKVLLFEELTDVETYRIKLTPKKCLTCEVIQISGALYSEQLRQILTFYLTLR